MKPNTRCFVKVRKVIDKHIMNDQRYNFGNIILTNFRAFFGSKFLKILGAITAEKNIRLPIKNGKRNLMICDII